MMHDAWAVLLGLLFGVGVLFMLQRSLVFLVIGLGLVLHAANLLLLLSGGATPGAAPILSPDGSIPSAVADPLPQALILTAIVIGFAITAFLLALIIKVTEKSRTDQLDDLKEDAL